MNSIKYDIKNYVKQLSLKFSINVEYFTAWQTTVIQKFKQRLSLTHITCKREKSILASEHEDLDLIKQHFVITGVDKAANNISFICKKFYIDTIDNELNNTETYELSDKSEEDIVREHIRFCSRFNISVTDRTLPFLHLLPKFHKPQMDYRFIAAGKKSSLKELSTILCSVLKLVDRTFKFSDSFKFRFKNTAGYWIAKSKDAAIDSLNYLNNIGSATSIRSFDFKKLYTNLPHDQVLAKISSLLKRCFEEKDVAFINVSNSFNASWSSKQKGKWSLTLDAIIEMFKFLMDNIFVKFRGRIYRQVIGVPMGCDCAPQVADLFLYWYEHSYISRETDNGNPVVHILKYCSRYIDDLNIPNASDDICNIICNDIYPNELEIVLTNSDPKNSTFLDLDIFIKDRKFHTKLYDKRRDFPFKVITFPNLSSNIPFKQSYGVFTGELHRLCKSCSNINDFVLEVQLLINKLCNQKFEKCILLKKLNIFLKKKPACLSKYWRNLNVNDFIF